MDISVKGSWLLLKCTVPAEPDLYTNSHIVIVLSSPTVRTIDKIFALRGFLRAKINSMNVWTHLNVSLQFHGYAGKRFTTIFRGRVMMREQGKQIKRVFSRLTSLARTVLKPDLIGTKIRLGHFVTTILPTDRSYFFY